MWSLNNFCFQEGWNTIIRHFVQPIFIYIFGFSLTKPNVATMKSVESSLPSSLSTSFCSFWTDLSANSALASAYSGHWQKTALINTILGSDLKIINNCKIKTKNCVWKGDRKQLCSLVSYSKNQKVKKSFLRKFAIFYVTRVQYHTCFYQAETIFDYSFSVHRTFILSIRLWMDFLVYKSMLRPLFRKNHKPRPNLILKNLKS